MTTTAKNRRPRGGRPAPAAKAADSPAPPPAAPPIIDAPYITPALLPLAVPVESLKLDPRNARKHNERNRASIRFSLEKFGQQKPISVDADGVILAGNGTYALARELGWKFIAAVRSHLRGAEARAFAIADNRTAELAEWDAGELTATLEELDADGFDLAGLEFSDEELDKLLSADQPSRLAPEQSAGGSSAAGGSLREQYKTVVEHASEDDQKAFLERMIAEGRKCRALSA